MHQIFSTTESDITQETNNYHKKLSTFYLLGKL